MYNENRTIKMRIVELLPLNQQLKGLINKKCYWQGDIYDEKLSISSMVLLLEGNSDHGAR